MKVYDADHIRNVALVGHQGCGKTTLTEAMLYTAGALNRRGTVEDGTTASDYHESEKERGMSVFSSLMHVEWKNYKVNILDTPGYPDFVGEVVTSLRIADTALIVINAAEGVQVGTEQAWTYAEKANIPAMFVLNQLDKGDTSFRVQVAQIRERFGRGAAIVQLPGGPGTRSIIDVLLMKQLSFPEGAREAVISDIDPAFMDEAEELHNELIESIAENDENLMELYFEEGTLTEDQMRNGLHKAMLKRELFPIFLTSAKENIGVSRLISFIDNVCPAPAEMAPLNSLDGTEVVPSSDGEPLMFIYRVMAEQHVGEYSFFRVYSGSIESGMDLENAETGATERLGQLFSLNGHDRESVQKMFTGDLGVLVKLKNTNANNTLRKKGSSLQVPHIEFPAPRYTEAAEPTREGDEDKLAQGLLQLAAEDPSLKITQDQLLSQLVVGGQGSMHLQIAKYRLNHRFGVDVNFVRPRVAYRETIQTRARSKYRHKKQTGGAGQFADISMLVEPLNGEFVAPDDINVRKVDLQETSWGGKIEFIDAIVGGVIDMRRFFGAIQKGVFEALQNGPIAGYPVGDVRIVIFDGGMHSVDSNEAAFKTASRMCFRDAFRSAKPALLEPIFDVDVMLPDTYTGDVMGDLSTRRGRIQGMEAEGVLQKIKVQMP